MTEAGWYPNPENRKQQKYWDGNSWTDQTRDLTIFDRMGGAGNASGPDDPIFPVNPLGTGTVLLGCLAIVVSLFLPFVSTTAFSLSGIKDNTLIQSLSGIGIRYLITAAIIAVLAVRAHMAGAKTWWPIIGGVMMLMFVAVDTSNNENFDLVRYAPNGELSFAGGTIEGDPGLAFYVAGVGGLLAIIGGVIMRNYPAPQRVAGAATGDDAVADARPMKQCPDCAETVLDEARVCRYCGHRFDDP